MVKGPRNALQLRIIATTTLRSVTMVLGRRCVKHLACHQSLYLSLIYCRLPQSSYYDNANRPAASLYRARQPYLVKNALTGLAIFGFVAGICEFHVEPYNFDHQHSDRVVDTFTIRAIGQDDFSDVTVPDAPVKPAQAPHMSTVKGA